MCCQCKCIVSVQSHQLLHSNTSGYIVRTGCRFCNIFFCFFYVFMFIYVNVLFWGFFFYIFLFVDHVGMIFYYLNVFILFIDQVFGGLRCTFPFADKQIIGNENQVVYEVGCYHIYQKLGECHFVKSLSFSFILFCISFSSNSLERAYTAILFRLRSASVINWRGRWRSLGNRSVSRTQSSSRVFVFFILLIRPVSFCNKGLGEVFGTVFSFFLDTVFGISLFFDCSFFCRIASAKFVIFVSLIILKS